MESELNLYSERWKTIKDKLDQEYARRIEILISILDSYQIPKDSLVVVPPVLTRTDFGYTSDFDLVFLGDYYKYCILYKELRNRGIRPFIINLNNVDRLDKILLYLPEFYLFLKRRIGYIPSINVGMSINENHLFNPQELEEETRKILTYEEKLRLREERIEIGKAFIKEVKLRVPVIGYEFSGSTMNNIEKFSFTSDLDINLLINPQDEELALYWIHMFLKWKFAEKFGIKIDVLDRSIKYSNLNSVYLNT